MAGGQKKPVLEKKKKKFTETNSMDLDIDKTNN